MLDQAGFYEEFDAQYRVQAQTVKVLMESEKYKDAYSSVIDEGLKIAGKSVGARICITKEPSKKRERTLRFIFLTIMTDFVLIVLEKYDSKKWRTKEPKPIFGNSLKEFQDLDLEELIKNNLEDYIPID